MLARSHVRVDMLPPTSKVFLANNRRRLWDDDADDDDGPNRSTYAMARQPDHAHTSFTAVVSTVATGFAALIACRRGLSG